MLDSPPTLPPSAPPHVIIDWRIQTLFRIGTHIYLSLHVFFVNFSFILVYLSPVHIVFREPRPNRESLRSIRLFPTLQVAIVRFDVECETVFLWRLLYLLLIILPRSVQIQNGRCKWQMHMTAANDRCECQLQTLANDICKWQLQMKAARESCT